MLVGFYEPLRGRVQSSCVLKQHRPIQMALVSLTLTDEGNTCIPADIS